MENWRANNRALWDERTGIHLAPGGYDLTTHRAGLGRLDAIVESEIGSVAGLRILHLQCHIGDDSIALIQHGASEVVGIDFSPAAIEAATALASELSAPARFVLSDVLAAAQALPDEAGRFDMVFTSWGTIGWLPDLAAWAATIAFFLKPGGVFYFADAHPIAMVFDGQVPGDPEARPAWFGGYFERGPITYIEAQDYANPEVALRHTSQIVWLHSVADILAALRRAGLRLDWLHEHPGLTSQLYPGLVRGPDRLWTWPGRPWLPLGLSLRAEKPIPSAAATPALD